MKMRPMIATTWQRRDRTATGSLFTWGAHHNYADREPENRTVLQPTPRQRPPRCYWPHFSVVVSYAGDVTPCCAHRT